MRGRENIGVLFSGGKDSSYVAYKIAKDPRFRLSCLITVIPSDPDSFLLHHVNAHWTSLQAKSMEVGHIIAQSSRNDEKEVLLNALEKAKKEFKINGIATGGILSRYQYKEFRELVSKVGLRYVSPIWLVNQENYLLQLYKEGFKIMMVKVAALGLDERWLGRILDLKAINELIELSKKYQFNPSLEGGEGETFVLDMPLFKKEIKVLKGERIWMGDRGVYIIKRAILVDKNVRRA